MKNHFPLPAQMRRNPRTWLFGGLASLLLLGATTGLASDRFIAPGPSDSSSTPPPAPPPSNSGSGSSYSPPPSNYSPPPSNDSGSRFISPGPSHDSGTGFQPGPGGGYSGGGYYGGGGGMHGGYPYWGGCYYWGGNYYFWGGHRYSPFYDQFFYDPLFSNYYDGYARRGSNLRETPIFFPPIPPPIGAPPPPKRSPVERAAAPKDLASHVYEPFYAPLSTRLYSKDLSKKLLSRLENYRTKRSALQTELQQKLASLKDAPAAERVTQLEAFSREQTPRIVELEATAEQLRSDLLHGGLVGFISGTGDWNETRQWRLGGSQSPEARTKTLIYEFLVMRAAVFYQEGLSPAQRRLLREVAMELQVEAFKPNVKETSLKGEEKWLYFSPETARIHIPTDVPEELEAKIALYQNEKNRLKTELRDAIYQYDNSSESKRTQALKQLAEQQATAIASLDLLADDIRAGLAALPKPPGPSTGPAFPPELSARINSYRKEKQALQKTVQARLEEIRTELAPQSKGMRPKSSTSDLSYQLEGGSRVPPGNLDKMREAVNQLNKENAQRFAQLDREKESIRSAVAAFAAAHRTAEGAPSVASLLSAFLTALREEESWQPYTDYQTAVYQPGLSPEQRRLFFEIALEKLALPLPEGEF
ncbi:MAG: hypothetical protein QM715_16730 [Nibricoccus sp.]